MTAVSAAIILSSGKILCMQNGTKKYPYLSNRFEFPGGKIEPGESPNNTLVREMQEELDLIITKDQMEEFEVLTYEYPDFTVTLHNFLVYTDNPEFTLIEHISYRWCTPEELLTVDWVDADKVIAEHLCDAIKIGRVKI